MAVSLIAEPLPAIQALELGWIDPLLKKCENGASFRDISYLCDNTAAQGWMVILSAVGHAWFALVSPGGDNGSATEVGITNGSDAAQEYD